MRVEVIKPFARYRVGDVIPEMPDNQAATLIRRGLVQEYQGGQAKRRRVDRSPADRMIATSPVEK